MGFILESKLPLGISDMIVCKTFSFSKAIAICDARQVYILLSLLHHPVIVIFICFYSNLNPVASEQSISPDKTRVRNVAVTKGKEEALALVLVKEGKPGHQK